MLKTLFEFNRNRFASIGVGLGTAIAMVLLSYSLISAQRYDWYTSFEHITFDMKQTLRPKLFDPVPEASEIVHINIDDKSIDLIGRWPWDRSIHGELVETLAELGVHSTMFDVEFYREQVPNIDEKRFEKELKSIQQLELDPVLRGKLADSFLQFSNYLKSQSGTPLSEAVAQEIYESFTNHTWPTIRAELKAQIGDAYVAEVDNLHTLTSNQDRRFTEGVLKAGNVILPFHWAVETKLDPRFDMPAPKRTGATRRDVMELMIRAKREVTDQEIADEIEIPKQIVERDRGAITRTMFLGAKAKEVGRKIVEENMYISIGEFYSLLNEGMVKDLTTTEEISQVRLDEVNINDNLVGFKNDLIEVILRDDVKQSRLEADADKPGLWNVGKTAVEMITEFLGDPEGVSGHDAIDSLETLYTQIHDRRFADRTKLFSQWESHYRLCFDRFISELLVRNIGPVSQPTDLALPIREDEMEPALFPLLINSYTTGYVTIQVDGDGILRRVPLLEQYQHDNRFYPQIAFRTMLDFLRVDPVNGLEVVPGDHILVKNATFPDGHTGDIRIPVDENCRVLIHWAGRYHGGLDEWQSTFKQMPFAAIINIARQKQRLRDTYLNALTTFALAMVNRDTYPFMNLYADLDIQKRLPGVHAAITDIVAKAGTEKNIPEKMRAALLAEIDKFPALGTSIAEEILALNADLVSCIDGSKAVDTAENKNKGTARYLFGAPRMRESQSARLFEVQSSLSGLIDDIKSYQESFNSLHDSLTYTGPDGKRHGKVCLVGSAHTGSTDFRSIPIHPFVPGVMLHSNVMNMMLNPGLFLKPTTITTNIIALLTIAALLSFFVSVLPVHYAILMSVAGSGAVLVTHTWVLSNYSVLLDTFLPMISCIFIGTTIIGYRYLTEDKKRRFLKASFEKFISKDYVAELIKNPDKLKLGGETRYMTAHFSDIQGFSSFSEILTPDKLVHVLNIYLTRMSNIINDHRGTIDKYEGDAVIAFYNAPLDDADHCEHAIEGGLQELRAIKEVNELLHADGSLPKDVSIKARVGLNSGDMVVGNMGSEKFFNYTMMGDNVNLASRLEGANKPFGTFFMVGSKTYEGAKDKFVFRRLAKLIVVGRKNAEPVYEPFGRPGEVSDKSKEMIKLFHAALEKFGQRKWNEAEDDFKFLLENYSDKASKRYLNLLEEYRTRTDLPDDWNGEIELTEK